MSVLNAMSDLTPCYMKIATNEVMDKLKIEHALSNLMDDLADIESAYGKNLTKVGSHGFSVGRRDCLPQFSSAWETIHKVSTVHNGKNHMAVSSALCHEIVKNFSEHMKLTKKKIQSILSKISGMVDEYKKGRIIYHKNLEKYHRVIGEFEATLKLKEKEDADTTTNSDLVYQNIPDNNSGNKVMNRSLTKMLAKMTQGDKNFSEKCKEQIKELETTEAQLAASNRRLNYNRSEIVSEISRAYSELEEVETSRVTILRDGLLKFSQSNKDLVVEKKQNLLIPIKEQLAPLDVASEFNKFLQVDAVEPQASLSLTLLHSLKSSGGGGTGVVKGLEIVNAKIERLCEGMEYLKLIVGRMCTVVKEIAEVEEVCYNAANKVIISHWGGGRRKSPVAESVSDSKFGSDTGAVNSGPGATLNALELLNRFESPSNKAGWLAFFRVIEDVNEAHSRTFDYYVDEIFNRLDVVFRQVDIWKCDLQRKHSEKMKVIEAAQSDRGQAVLKLQKLQTLLKERKYSLRIAKDSLSNGGDDTTTHDLADMPMEGECGDDSSSISSVAQSVNLGEADLKKKKTMMQGFENLSSSLANVKFKVVVGLETPADRISRIEKQLAALEEEERSLTDAATQANANVEQLVESIRVGLNEDFDNTQQLTITDLQMLKSTLDSLVEWQFECIDCSKRAFDSIQNISQAIDIKEDLLNFTRFIQVTGDFIRDDGIESLIQSSSNNGSSGVPPSTAPGSGNASSGSATATTSSGNSAFLTKVGQSMLIDIPQIDAFEPIKNATVDEVRKNISMQYSRSLTNSTGENSATLSGSTSAVAASSNANKTTKLRTEIPVSIDESGADGEAEGGDEVDASFSAADSEGGAGSGPPRKPTKPKQSTPVSQGTQPTQQTMSQTIAAAGFASLQSLVSPNPTPSKAAMVENSSNSSNYYSNFGSTQPKEESELSKFGLSANEKILESFSCALYPNKGLLTHGRLFVTQRYLAFSGWPDTKVLLALRNVEKLEKSNTLVYIPNAISIVTSEKEEYFFGSFIERDQCYQLLHNMREVERRLIALHGSEAILETDKNLDFGYLNRASMFTGKDNKEGFLNAASSAVKFKPVVVGALVDQRSRSGTRESNNLDNAVSLGHAGDTLLSISPVAASATSTEIGAPLSNESISSARSDSTTPMNFSSTNEEISTTITSPIRIPTEVVRQSSDGSASQKVSSPSSSLSAVTHRPQPNSDSDDPVNSAPVDTFSADNGDGIDLVKLFASCGIASLGEKSLGFCAMDVYSHCWLKAAGYSDFLAFNGDLSITSEEWKPLPSKGLLPAEDVSKLRFSHFRRFSYSHPRTTMLMFGPKNAPATQVQYLYLPCRENIVGGAKSFDDLKRYKPLRGLVLTITQFDGIPMADVFKVMQYWTFESNSLSPQSCMVRVGVAMHYIKSTMFKSQILNGTKEELGDQVKSWFSYSESSIRKQIAVDALESKASATTEGTITIVSSAAGAVPVKSESDLPVSGASTTIVSRRSSFAVDNEVVAPAAAVAVGNTAATSHEPRSGGAEETNLSLDSAPVHKADKGGGVEAWSLSTKLNVLFFVIFAVMVAVQWLHNRALTSQMGALRDDLRSQQLLLQQSFSEIHKLLERLARE